MPFGTVTLNDGNKLPTIAFGTGTAWYGRDASEYVIQAIEEGFSHIDTAAAYQNEESVGVAIKESALSRSDLYITTKYKGGDIREGVKDSIDKIGIRQLDLYLIHHPRLVSDSGIENAWREFEAIKADGISKSIGVSNFDLEQLKELVKIAKVKPAVNQISFNPYKYAETKDLLEFCAQHGIITEAYSSLVPITRSPGGPVDAPVAAAAKRLGITPTQVILKWVRSKGVVIVTTSSSKEHLREYLAVEDIAPLTTDEIAAIDKAGSQQLSSESVSAWKWLFLLLIALMLWYKFGRRSK